MIACVIGLYLLSDEIRYGLLYTPEEPIESNPSTKTFSDTLKYLILNKDVCGKQNPHILIWVYSAIANHERRNAIRNTWGNTTLYLPLKISLIFSLARHETYRQQQTILEEQARYGDLVQDSDFVDTYDNLVYKVGYVLRVFFLLVPQLLLRPRFVFLLIT